jgi:hypothetical protein
VPHIRFRRPSPAMAVALAALFVAMGGSAVAATQLLVHTKDIANGAVTNRKLANGAIGLSKLIRPIRSELLKAGGPRGIVTGPRGFQGTGGNNGSNGSNGSNGRDGANPGVAVVNVPSIASSSGKNLNPDSGDPGDGGWYFSGNSGGSAALTNGELELNGVKVDSATTQGGVGIAKAFNKVPLTSLNALSYSYHVNQLNGAQVPVVHITLTGGTGFTNLVSLPVAPTLGVDYAFDGFTASGPDVGWYSTHITSGPGSISSPVPLQEFQSTLDPSGQIVQISLDNGGSSSNTTGTFDAGADNLILGFTGAPFTRYDFGG